jgi:hypothetical protein
LPDPVKFKGIYKSNRDDAGKTALEDSSEGQWAKKYSAMAQSLGAEAPLQLQCIACKRHRVSPPQSNGIVEGPHSTLLLGHFRAVGC